ncbi:hypothetical protein [Agrobacterium cavarae]|uniref:hypothetical protein n=1 Tax=Agrobacterium cavarae TaxID=2528239 RepID=UPI003FD4F3A9
MKQLLLVEDDEYKATDLIKNIGQISAEAHIQKAASVTSALKLISESSFDLIVLDMSLPTFDISGPGGGGSPQGQGGVEVLRLAGRLRNSSPFIVVTQYPDIEIEGREMSLASASTELTSKFGVSVLGCLLYEFDGDAWRLPFQNLIRQAGI